MPRKQLRPPIKMRKRFAPLIELCRVKILTAAPQTSGTLYGDKGIAVKVMWPYKPGTTQVDLPEDFPTGLVLSREPAGVVVKHLVTTLLSYFKSKGYVNYNAGDLFAQRLPVMMQLCKMELKLERLLQDIDVELPQD